MIRFGKLLLLIAPLVVGALWGVHPGRAQDAESPRFAFADTTLLRDTLGITFQRLFPLSDSLGMVPDTLRALSIRYLYTPTRLVQLADSLHVPVDSVGVVLERERFNPLSRTGERVSKFNYNTTYDVQRTSNSWRNASDFSFGQGPVFIHNIATIQLDRYNSAGLLSRRQQRDSSTEGGWKLSRDFSIGGRADLSRFDSSDPSSISNVGETRNEFKLSVRSRQSPRHGVTSELNFLSGYLDLANSSLEKKGLTNDLNGRLRLEYGRWLVHELSGQLTGNVAHSRLPADTVNTRVNTHDFTNNLRGTLSLYQDAPVGFNANYAIRGIRIETPAAHGLVNQTQTKSNGGDATLRFRQNNDRYVNLTERFGNDDQASATGQNTTRNDEGFSADARYAWIGWILESRFSNIYSVTAVPRITAIGGYGERQHARGLTGALSRALSRRLTTRLSGEVGVTSFRYYPIGTYNSLPVTRDQYRQSYRMEFGYTPVDRFNTGVTLDVSRNQLINIPSANVLGNNEIRTYRAEWRWTYRLFSGLTATQRNSIASSYNYQFIAENNRVTLDYNAVTTLNAVLTPTLTINITHNAQQTPSGNFIDDAGTLYFLPADESQTYLLDASIAYSPTSAFSIAMQPRYRASDRNVTVSGESAPQRQSRNLTFTGRASLNLNVGQRGHLTGDIGRTFTADRSTTYISSVPTTTPITETDYWNGSLQFSWQL